MDSSDRCSQCYGTCGPQRFESSIKEVENLRAYVHSLENKLMNQIELEVNCPEYQKQKRNDLVLEQISLLRKHISYQRDLLRRMDDETFEMHLTKKIDEVSKQIQEKKIEYEQQRSVYPRLKSLSDLKKDYKLSIEARQAEISLKFNHLKQWIFPMRRKFNAPLDDSSSKAMYSIGDNWLRADESFRRKTDPSCPTKIMYEISPDQTEALVEMTQLTNSIAFLVDFCLPFEIESSHFCARHLNTTRLRSLLAKLNVNIIYLCVSQGFDQQTLGTKLRNHIENLYDLCQLDTLQVDNQPCLSESLANQITRELSGDIKANPRTPLGRTDSSSLQDLTTAGHDDGSLRGSAGRSRSASTSFLDMKFLSAFCGHVR